MHKHLHLAGSFNCVQHVVAETQSALDQHSSVHIIAFSKDLFDFLRPLDNIGVKVEHADEISYPRLFFPDTWIRCHREVRKFIKSRMTECRYDRVFAYGTGISLAEMAAVGILIRSKNLTLKPYDGFYEDSRFHTPAKGWKTKMFGKLISMICGVPIEMMRPWAPVPMIKERYLEENCAVIIKDREYDDHRNLKKSNCWEILSTTSVVKVLWLYEDYIEYYGKERIDQSVFEAIWTDAVKIISAFFPLEHQAVKVHPGFTKSLPVCFSGMEELDRKIPIEFFDFPGVKLVVGISSLAMKKFIGKEGITVIGILYLIGGDKLVVEEGEIILKAAINKNNEVSVVHSIDHFRQCVETYLPLQ